MKRSRKVFCEGGDPMENERAMPFYSQGRSGSQGEQTSDIETWGGVWLVDSNIRMQKKHHYVHIVRNRVLEEKKLREAGWCELFQARILPAVCRQRRDLGYNCDACRGIRNGNGITFPLRRSDLGWVWSRPC